MTNKPKATGTTAETAVVKYLRASGWPYADRAALHGGKDIGDVQGTPGLVWEVKAGEAAKSLTDRLIRKWLDETDVETLNANADIGLLVLQRRGFGAMRVGWWWVAQRDGTHYQLRSLESVTTWLRSIGYGNPLEG